MNIQDAAVQVLKEAGKPLHTKEITERIIKAGLWTTKSKTPEATVSAHLYSEIKLIIPIKKGHSFRNFPVNIE